MQLSALITELEEFVFLCPYVKVVSPVQNNLSSCGDSGASLATGLLLSDLLAVRFTSSPGDTSGQL